MSAEPRRVAPQGSAVQIERLEYPAPLPATESRVVMVRADDNTKPVMSIRRDRRSKAFGDRLCIEVIPPALWVTPGMLRYIAAQMVEMADAADAENTPPAGRRLN